MPNEKIQQIIEAALMAAGEPLSITKLQQMFRQEETKPNTKEIRQALTAISACYADRSVELQELASGYCFQVHQDYAPWLRQLWDEKPARYSRALLETLVLIAYRQPITRGEIEKVRGVAVSTHITKILLERDWIRVLGHKDVPGKPSLYGTTKAFLDYFNLKSLDELPPLAEIKDLDKVEEQLAVQLKMAIEGQAIAGDAPESEIVPETQSEATSEAEPAS